MYCKLAGLVSGGPRVLIHAGNVSSWDGLSTALPHITILYFSKIIEKEESSALLDTPIDTFRLLNYVPITFKTR